MRIVRIGFTPKVLSMRMASNATAVPDELSLALELPCQVSKCAPTITIPSLGFVPGISPTKFIACSTLSPILFFISSSIFTAIPLFNTRYILL